VQIPQNPHQGHIFTQREKNLFSIHRVSSTWTISEAWAHTGFVAGAKNGEHEYFDSFGISPPNEWELELKKLGKKSFLRNDNQPQWVGSVRCGYYCCFF